MANIHELVGSKVQLYQRNNSPFWWCAATIGTKRHRISTKKLDLREATTFAEDWVLNLRGVERWGGGSKSGVKFKVAATRFLDEFTILTEGQRSPAHVAMVAGRVKNYLIPYFGEMVVPEINSSAIQAFRIHLHKVGAMPRGRPFQRKDGVTSQPAHHSMSRSSMHQIMVCLRQVLKLCIRERWIEAMPDLTVPYKTSGKIKHRAWFSPDEYKTLYEATRERAANPKSERYRRGWEDLHDAVLFVGNCGLRPDETMNLEMRDIEVVTDKSMNERIVEIEVRGKRGVGFCKSMPGAVHPFRRVRERHTRQLREKLAKAGGPGASTAELDPTHRPFANLHSNMLNIVLDELGLKFDRDGQIRTFYSLRHTYICMRLIDGADIYALAKNCRTSVEMIQEYYASHIKDLLDTSFINVRKRKAPPRKAATTPPPKPSSKATRARSASTASV